MKIGLVDVDSHNFPNLALMKISNFYKKNNCDVEFIIPLEKYDVVCMSKIFTFTNDFDYCIQANEIHKGGAGYNINIRLPEKIEKQFPDYSLYGITDTAYGYLSRGCPRQCDFCIVSKLEGCKSVKVADVNNFWNGQKNIKLLDPNILACKERIELLQQLIDCKANIDFTQGLDVRLLNEEIIYMLNKMKIKRIHFAWDSEKDSEIILKKLNLFKKYTTISNRKIGVYILTNYNTNIEFDLHRIYTIRDIGYDPFVMVYNIQNAKKIYRHMQRWCNRKWVFKKCKNFEDYITK